MNWLAAGLGGSTLIAIIFAVVYRARWQLKARDLERLASDFKLVKASLAEANEKLIASAQERRELEAKFSATIQEKNDAVESCRRDYVRALGELSPEAAVSLVAPMFDRVLSAGGDPLRRPPSPDSVLTGPAAHRLPRLRTGETP